MIFHSIFWRKIGKRKKYLCGICQKRYKHTDVRPTNNGLYDYLICRKCAGSIKQATLLKKLFIAAKTASSLHSFAYHLGYQRIEIPCYIRWHFRRSSLHRDWLAGYIGIRVNDALDKFDF